MRRKLGAVIPAILILMPSSTVLSAQKFSDKECVKKVIALANPAAEETIFTKEKFVMGSEEDPGIHYLASVNGSQQQDLGLLDYRVWREDDGTYKIIIEQVLVKEEVLGHQLRGKGISKKLYREMMRRINAAGQNATSTSTGGLTGTNKEVALEKFIENLRGKKGFKKPNPTDSLEQQFVTCCKDIYERYPELQIRAVSETPAHRAHADIGLTKVCEGNFLIQGDTVSVNLASCK